jgi:threonine synthase
VNYVSTRGRAPVLAFDDVVLAGLARDGGLYVPAAWPRLTAGDLAAMRDLGYAELTARILALFAAPTIGADTLAGIAADAYLGFDDPQVAPLRRLGNGQLLLELFHGPTLAFKDYALQILGRLFDHVLAERDSRVTIVGATSGDTGSAAIEACRDRERIEIFILHPQGRVSEVQRRQMTTVTSDNVHNIAVEGTFDDCQALVKAMFNDVGFRDRYRLSAVNSINWARIAAQVVYYVHAALALGAPDRPVIFAVPTGNFGNVFAAFAAGRIGVPISRLIVASNRNDILTRFFATGRMEIGPVHTTLSPSMDIQISSNFERYLFEVLDRNAGAVVAAMDRFRREGCFTVTPAQLDRILATFSAERLTDDDTRAAMRQVFDETGELVDPHTAIGLAAAAAYRPEDGTPVVAVATAHPAKFPHAVEQATGVRPPLPHRLADLYRRPERFTALPADIAAIQTHIGRTLAGRGL